MLVVDSYSTSASYLSLSFNDRQIAHGTGFFYLYNGKMFFVTALHNLTGVHWETGKNLHAQAARPSHATIHSWIRVERNSEYFLGSGHHKICLYRDDQPIWMDSVIGERKADIAVIDLAKVAGVMSLIPELEDQIQFQDWFGKDRDFTRFFHSVSLNENIQIPYVNDKTGPYEPVVGQDLFIIGYPLNFARAGEFPIWKRGSIATEPKQDYDQLPAYLIDAVTREGLSGSPVIGAFVNPSFDNGGKGVLTLVGTERAFAGLYSSRISSQASIEIDKRDDFSAQMGLVWKPSVIDQIIETNTK